MACQCRSRRRPRRRLARHPADRWWICKQVAKVRKSRLLMPSRRGETVSAMSSSRRSWTSTSTSKPVSLGKRRQVRQCRRRPRGDDEQYAVRAEGPRLEHLVGVDDEVLAQHRQAARTAGSLEMAVRPLEIALVREHREAGRASPLVGRGDGRRVEVPANHAGAGRGALDLRDHRRALGAHGVQKAPRRRHVLGRSAHFRQGPPLPAGGHLLALAGDDLVEDAHDSPIMRVRSTKFGQLLLRLSSGDHVLRQHHAVAQGAAHARRVECRAAVQRHDVRRRFVAAVERRAQQRQTLRRRRGTQIVHRALPQAHVRGRELEGIDPAVLQFHDLRRRMDRQLRPSHRSGRPARVSAPSRRQTSAIGRCHWAPKTPRRLAFRASRIGERAEQIEDRADAEFAAHRPGVAHRRMVAGREQKAHADLGDAAPHLFRRQRQIDARGFQHVCTAAGARHGAVAVLGHLGAARSGDEGRSGGDVEPLGAAAAAGAAGVHQIRQIDGDFGGHGAHRLRGAGDFVRRFALGLERDEHGGDLRWRRIAGHDDVEDELGLGLLEVAPGHHGGKEVGQRRLAPSVKRSRRSGRQRSGQGNCRAAACRPAS